MLDGVQVDDEYPAQAQQGQVLQDFIPQGAGADDQHPGSLEPLLFPPLDEPEAGEAVPALELALIKMKDLAHSDQTAGSDLRDEPQGIAVPDAGLGQALIVQELLLRAEMVQLIAEQLAARGVIARIGQPFNQQDEQPIDGHIVRHFNLIALVPEKIRTSIVRYGKVSPPSSMNERSKSHAPKQKMR